MCWYREVCGVCGERLGDEDWAEGLRGIVHAGCWVRELDDPPFRGSSLPAVELAGHDGNAFAILGRCCRVAREAGWSEDEIRAFTDDACSGDYDNLLTTVMLNFDVV